MDPKFTLTLSCPDQVGIVAAVSGFLAAHGGWITEASHHADPDSRWFFMRQEMLAHSLPFDLPGLKERFAPIAQRFHMTWSATESVVPKRVVILVSRQDHCLADLLYRWRARDFQCDLVAVISNHEDLRPLVEWHEIPFHCVPVPPDSKEVADREIDRLIQHYQGDVVVLARYMQILTTALCERYAGRIINIHHSFLPSFVGAKPYHQAHTHGVKLIGATCHYVTPELDTGPIIEQDVIRVDHGDSAERMRQLGRDVEKLVLARGLRYHLEDRVLIHGNKTVVFS